MVMKKYVLFVLSIMYIPCLHTADGRADAAQDRDFSGYTKEGRLFIELIKNQERASELEARIVDGTFRTGTVLIPGFIDAKIPDCCFGPQAQRFAAQCGNIEASKILHKHGFKRKLEHMEYCIKGGYQWEFMRTLYTQSDRIFFGDSYKECFGLTPRVQIRFDYIHSFKKQDGQHEDEEFLTTKRRLLTVMFLLSSWRLQESYTGALPISLDDTQTIRFMLHEVDSYACCPIA